MRKTYRNKRSGGAATVMPLSYYNPGAQRPDAPAGGDLLKAALPDMVRPKIGGRRKAMSKSNSKSNSKSKSKSKSKKSKGGFVPSVMGGFVNAASKYIVPIALYAGYRLMTRKRRTTHSR